MELPIRYVILASGGGSTAAKIIDETRPGRTLDGLYKVVCLIATKPDIGAIERARDRKVKVYTLDKETCRDPARLAKSLHDKFEAEHADMFGLHGCVVPIPEDIAMGYVGLNQHPTHKELGGKGMYGLATHEAKIRLCQLLGRWDPTEAICQRVDPMVDAGELIFSWPVEVRDDDTPQSLQARVLPIEHLVQVAALLRFVACQGNPSPIPSSLVLNPGEEGAVAEAIAWAREHHPHG